jgi:TonB family protein
MALMPTVLVLLSMLNAGQSPARVLSAWPAVFVDLAYPPDALAARVSGPVVVRVSTDEAGRVTAAESLSGPDLLAQAALQNVRQWTLWAGAGTEVIVYQFEIDPGRCNDDTRSLFRLAYRNGAVITACTAAGRAHAPEPDSGPSVVSTGGPSFYPPIANSARVAGLVVLELSLDRHGVVADARVLAGVPLLNDAAVAHMKKWRFEPSKQRQVIFIYEFALGSQACDDHGTTTTEFRRIGPNYWRVTGCARYVET